jgi:hypothetical protein
MQVSEHCCAPLQMAARETGFGAVEAYMHQGKLLALDLVVRLLENPLQVTTMLSTCAVTHNPIQAV